MHYVALADSKVYLYNSNITILNLTQIYFIFYYIDSMSVIQLLILIITIINQYYKLLLFR
jgi:hypothetical protein